MIFAAALVALRALVRISQRATQGGERHELAVNPQPPLDVAEARGSGVDPEPGADPVRAATAQVTPSKHHRCARGPDCGNRAYNISTEVTPLDLFWVGDELVCAPCARKEGHVVGCPPTYDDGAALGCPDCATGEPHACPFLEADAMPEPKRTRVLRHLRGALADEIAEVRA